MQRTRAYIISVLLIIGTVLLSGCGSTLKQTWRNFTAYYNTYYNAKRAYQTGIEQVREQRVTINPEQPIRIHPAPVGAGQQNFQKAITKGAKILRKYPKSKWVDDALSLIGKSYYYRQEYFSAEQKFRELYANAKKQEMKERAVLWQGRILMELELYSQGISYLQNELGNQKKWKPAIKAEIQSVLAELFSYLSQWKSANQYLVDAIPQLEDETHKARAYFLHGQVLERMDRLEEAFGAYQKVPGLHPEYDLIYHARRKQAEVSREAGKLERAYQIFVEMSKDDKNFEILPELKYEIARTLQEMGKTQQALNKYKEVLYSPNHQPNAPTTAKTYYGIAHLYRYKMQDFKMAAAYYDSAASVNVEEEKLPVDFQAQELSKSFGEYASLKKQINEADSLMRLGKLPKAKFDSVLAEIREKRKKKIEQMRQNQQKNANTMVSGAKQQYSPENTPSAAKTSGSGFLNYQNKKRVLEARQQFQAFWGDRPLVDHWRRIDMIRDLKQESDTSIARAEESNAPTSGPSLQELNINLQEIPFSKEAQHKKQQEIHKAQYELANTFFLSLNMPDSARRYYNKILNQAPDTTNLVPQTLYSLSELYFIENDSLKARQFADRIVEKYPETEFARRVADRFGYSLPERNKRSRKDRIDSLSIQYQQMIDSINVRHSLARARAYKNFSRQYEGNRAAAYALYQSATEYATAARIEHGPPEKEYPRKAFENLFSSEKDTSQPLASLSNQSAVPADAGISCSGMHWDSTRSMVKELHTNYSGIRVKTRISSSVEGDSLFSCRDIQLEAVMDPEMQKYVEQLKKSRPYDHSLDEAGLTFVKLREQLIEQLTIWKAEKLRNFALTHSSAKIAPTAMHDASRYYMKLGRRDSLHHSRVDRWFQEKARFERQKNQLQQRRDSLKTILDTLGVEPGQKEPSPDVKPQSEKKDKPKDALAEKLKKKINQDKAPDKREPQNSEGDDKQPNPQEPEKRSEDQKAESDTTRQISDKKLKALKSQLKKLQDSTAAPPDYEEVFPYLGAYWDSARVVLDQFASNFSSSRLSGEVEQLQQELKIPDELTRDEDAAAQTDSTHNMPADSLQKTTAADTAKVAQSKVGKDSTAASTEVVKEKVYTCEELNKTPNFDGNINDFVNKIELPPKYQSLQQNLKVKFNVLFDKKGVVKRAEPTTMGTKEGFYEAIQEAIQKHITMDPVVQQGDSVRVRCKVTIPINMAPDQ